MLQLVWGLLSDFCQHDFEFDMYIFSAWFFSTHLDSWSVKSSNLFRGINFREVRWWQDADAAELNAADVELLDGVSSNRFGLGEPLVIRSETSRHGEDLLKYMKIT